MKNAKRSKKKITKAQEVHRLYGRNPGLLDDREKDIVEKYYGFGGHMRHTLEEIARDYGITRERIRQIKHYAVTKLENNETN